MKERMTASSKERKRNIRPTTEWFSEPAAANTCTHTFIMQLHAVPFCTWHVMIEKEEKIIITKHNMYIFIYFIQV